MTEAQVLAATRTTEGAWNTRDAGASTIMVPASGHPARRERRMSQPTTAVVTTPMRSSPTPTGIGSTLRLGGALTIRPYDSERKNR